MANYTLQYEMVWLNLNKEKETIDIEFKELLVNDSDSTDFVEKRRFRYQAGSEKYQLLQDLSIDFYDLAEQTIDTTLGELLLYLANCAGNITESNFSIDVDLLTKFGTDGLTVLNS